MTLPTGEELQRLDKLHERRYVSIFGEFQLQRVVYGSRENGPPANDLHDIPVTEIPSLPNTPSPKPMPNFPITDIAGQNSGGPNNGS